MNNYKNNHRRNRFKSNGDRNYRKRNGNGHKINGEFNNNHDFKRKNPGKKVSPQGLYLMNVEYPKHYKISVTKDFFHYV